MESLRGELVGKLPRFGVRARAVADEPRVLRQRRKVRLGVIEGHAHGPRDMSSQIVRWRPCVEDSHSRAAIQLRLHDGDGRRPRLGMKADGLRPVRVERRRTERNLRHGRWHGGDDGARLPAPKGRDDTVDTCRAELVLEAVHRGAVAAVPDGVAEKPVARRGEELGISNMDGWTGHPAWAVARRALVREGRFAARGVAPGRFLVERRVAAAGPWFLPGADERDDRGHVGVAQRTPAPVGPRGHRRPVPAVRDGAANVVVGHRREPIPVGERGRFVRGVALARRPMADRAHAPIVLLSSPHGAGEGPRALEVPAHHAEQHDERRRQRGARSNMRHVAHRQCTYRARVSLVTLRGRPATKA